MAIQPFFFFWKSEVRILLSHTNVHFLWQFSNFMKIGKGIHPCVGEEWRGLSLWIHMPKEGRSFKERKQASWHTCEICRTSGLTRRRSSSRESSTKALRRNSLQKYRGVSYRSRYFIVVRCIGWIQSMTFFAEIHATYSTTYQHPAITKWKEEIHTKIRIIKKLPRT